MLIPKFITDLVFKFAELERKVDNMIMVGTVCNVDIATRRIRLNVGDNKTAWLPWPVDNGANFTRWRPIRSGQQFVIANASGNASNGLIIGEIYSDEIKSTVNQRDTDHVQFSNGSYFSHNVKTGVMSFKAPGGFKFIGNMDLDGRLHSTGDQVAGSVSTQKHTHEKTAPHPKASSGKPNQ